MSHITHWIYKIYVPDIKPGEKFEGADGYLNNGDYEKEGARPEVVLAQGTRVMSTR